MDLHVTTRLTISFYKAAENCALCIVLMVYLKRNILIFLRTLRIFIYDPLVEWQKSRGRETANDIKTKKATGEVTNEEVSKKNDLPIEILEELRMSKQRSFI